MCKSAWRSALLGLLASAVTADVPERIVQISLRAMELVEALKDQNMAELTDARLFVNGSDAALLAKEDGNCYAIFDTTEAFSLADWGKNIDPATAEICSLPHDKVCCKARRGYQQAYVLPSYRASLDVGIMMCYEQGYEIILVGHSAGGAIASVAAVALSEMDPTILTFGQPAALVGNCSVINEEKYYHWVNTDVNTGWLSWGGDENLNLDYDPVPDLTLTTGSQHVGQLLVMGNDEENVVLYRNGKTPNMMTWGFDAMAHSSSQYIERLESFQDKGDLGTAGWSKDFVCNVNEECRSGTCGGTTSYFKSGTCQG